MKQPPGLNVKLDYLMLLVTKKMLQASQDPSEIILICWFAAQKTLLVINNVENILYLLWPVLLSRAN